MQPDKNDPTQAPPDSLYPPADYGNASNPSPHHGGAQPADSNQLLDGHAEKYLREVASIEDVPDAEDQEEMDETIKEAQQKSSPESDE